MVLLAKDIVERDFVSLGPEATALEAAKLMKENHRGFLIVFTKEEKPVGIVTEWDFLSKVLSEDRDASDVKLEEIMSVDLVTVKSTDGINSVAKIMADRGIRRVLVTDVDGKIMGAVTSRTILRNLNDYIDKVSAHIARLQTPLF